MEMCQKNITNIYVRNVKSKMPWFNEKWPSCVCLGVNSIKSGLKYFEVASKMLSFHVQNIT